MGRDEALRTSLVALAAAVAVVGVITLSPKKMMATYAFGIAGIAGLLLPDWEFFDRDFSQWFSPMPAPRGHATASQRPTARFKLFPLRFAVIATVYCFGIYKWWTTVSS